jgi:hypothetical protein
VTDRLLDDPPPRDHRGRACGEVAPDQVIQASPLELKPDFVPGMGDLRVLVAIVISHVADRFLPIANLSLIFSNGGARRVIRFGLWPSVYTSLLSFFVYNFFFTEPHYTFLWSAGRHTDGRLLSGGCGHRR